MTPLLNIFALIFFLGLVGGIYKAARHKPEALKWFLSSLAGLLLYICMIMLISRQYLPVNTLPSAVTTSSHSQLVPAPQKTAISGQATVTSTVYKTSASPPAVPAQPKGQSVVNSVYNH